MGDVREVVLFYHGNIACKIFHPLELNWNVSPMHTVLRSVVLFVVLQLNSQNLSFGTSRFTRVFGYLFNSSPRVCQLVSMSGNVVCN